MYSYGDKSQSGGASSTSSSGSLKNFEFDFTIGAGSNRGSSRPLRDQKTAAPAANSYTSSWTPNKPSWTHQPSPSAAATAPSAARSGLQNTNPMVGDIFGKSWSSTAAPSGGGNGIRSSDPSLFGDLLGSALGQGRGGGIGGKVPLKDATPKNTYSMGNISDSLPKPNSASGSYNSGNSQTRSSYFPSNGSTIGNPRPQPMKLAGQAPSGKQDPFGSLVDFSSKPTPKPSPAAAPNPVPNISKSEHGNFPFAGIPPSDPPKPAPIDSDFDIFNVSSKNTAAQPPKFNADPLDSLFSSATSSSSNQPVQENDWNLGAEFGGDESGGPTTELQDLPPPPAGVSSSIAVSKGTESYKQGQFADGIKWLSWAFLLLEKSGDKSAIAEVLTCRASCYKEVGEYKKAIADCSKVLERDGKNVSVLVQRALLYESSEKYKLGAEDLREVLKLDPMNRVARSTIHRLTQMAG